MRKIYFKAVAVLVIALTVVSCSNDDTTASGTGNLKVEFENGFAGNTLILGSPMMATTQNEILKITTVKYIVSNIVLTKEDGTTFTYPKGDSYFIVDAANPSSLILTLNNIPAANYSAIKFGIGMDEAQYNLGADGQGDFWTLAQAAGMTWGWASGYKFVAFEGTFTSPTVASDTSFMVHTGKTGTDYNYTEISLVLPTKALVRTDVTPQIHLSTDLSKIIDGTNKISLTANNGMGMGAMIMGGSNLALITENLSDMFEVEHVHNDSN